MPLKLFGLDITLREREKRVRVCVGGISTWHLICLKQQHFQGNGNREECPIYTSAVPVGFLSSATIWATLILILYTVLIMCRVCVFKSEVAKWWEWPLHLGNAILGNFGAKGAPDLVLVLVSTELPPPHLPVLLYLSFEMLVSGWARIQTQIFQLHHSILRMPFRGPYC